ncbi:gamma carbonic anhydrase family protein [Halomonas campaniensis]|uniref:Anhydrase n=1 Tax=Halomonas campaniensis TaxID=213554 RepID=A0A246S432_9GAMM|nr:gamma carbonic anhydrase family protein [Halomonas campaniensis]OWV31179.1 anhydrase [Halomonas campaniensis]
MSIYRYDGVEPDIHTATYVADTADVIGYVTLAKGSSVWYQAVLRGDNEQIEIGENSNVQEGAVLHTDPGYPMKVGRGVTIGHQAMLHGCTVGDGSLIGIQAVILNGAIIGKNCLVGAGAVVTEGKEFPDNSLIIGAPAKVLRQLSDEAIVAMKENANHYIERAQLHKDKLEKIG